MLLQLLLLQNIPLRCPEDVLPGPELFITTFSHIYLLCKFLVFLNNPTLAGTTHAVLAVAAIAA